MHAKGMKLTLAATAISAALIGGYSVNNLSMIRSDYLTGRLAQLINK